MEIQLFQDVNTNLLLTYTEIKNQYAEANNSDLPIDDDTMELIVFENLTQNGGDLVMIEDDITSWIADYSIFMEADRYLNQEEKEFSVKNIYECIRDKDDFCNEIKKHLTINETGMELLARLDVLLK